MYGHLQKDKITKYDLQQLMLKHRVSINELFLKTGIPVNKIKGYLTGRRAIPDNLSDRIKQIGENNGR
jgi:hypothetical protein